MPAPQEIDTTVPSIKKLGVIAGGGALPAYLVSVCEEQNIETFIVGFEGQTEQATMTHDNHMWSHLGAAGKIMAYFKENDVRDLVMIGHIKRPAFSELKPDLKAVQILSRIGMKALGDNGLLTTLKKELENEGFQLHGIQKFCNNLLAKEGPLGKTKPQDKDQTSISVGLRASQEIGALDIGQAVIVQNGIVIGVEAVEGTDDLIRRCASLQKKGRGGILIKTCKPNQDKDLDLPTIGIDTIRTAQESGLIGIAIQSEHVIIIDPKSVAEYADRYKIFVCGVSLPDQN
tara:strand:+ start:1581 stop:2444 length:864 start_codon:yes stop_codon:yes gene_type:complete